jgi:hypothetical protein
MSFWDLVFPEESVSQKQVFASLNLTCFDEFETQRLLEVIRMFIEKKTEICQLFLDRVTETIADDYKCYVPAEMWLKLIMERLSNKYYRSENQLWYDLDMIAQCSRIYNGQDD